MLTIISRIRGLMDRARPKVLDQGDTRESNWVGRFAQWTERHYLLMDVIATIVLIALFDSATYGDLQMIGNAPYSPNRVLTITLTIIMLSPLAFRRRFPEGSALVMAILSAVQLLFLPSILTVNMFALVSVHAAVLYGREHAWRWVSVALVADSWLAGIKIMSGWNGYGMLIQMLLPFNGESAMSRWLLVLSGLMPGGVVMLFGFACIAMARWSRSRGSNALVLMQREEALKAEQERQKVLAANLERNRIGTAMQAEVLNTLESVITQADDGLAMLNSEPAPDSEQIIAAFTVIGERGRAALAHMRQLLTVLRETGFSDEMHEGAQPDMQLRPAAPLSSQMRQAESSISDGFVHEHELREQSGCPWSGAPIGNGYSGEHEREQKHSRDYCGRPGAGACRFCHGHWFAAGYGGGRAGARRRPSRGVGGIPASRRGADGCAHAQHGWH